MRLLVLGHSYVVDRNCATLQAFARQDQATEVRLLVPSSWPAGGIRGRRLRPGRLREKSFRRIPTATAGAPNQSALLYGPRLPYELLRWRPDVVQVELGAKSLALFQVLVWRKLFQGRFPVVFFTWSNVPYTLRWPILQLERFNLRGADAAVVGNAAAGEILRDHGFRGLMLERPLMGTSVEEVSVATSRSWRRRLCLDPELPTIVFTGRLHRQKGIDLLLAALGEIADLPWQAVIAGRGPESDAVAVWRETSSVGDRLRWCGPVEPEDVAAVLSCCDLLVLPSRSDPDFRTLTSRGWEEQFGMVLIEAMAQGVPVVASSSGAIPEVVGEAGLLFEQDSLEALKQALRRLLLEDELRRDLSARGRERVRTRYSTDAVARRHHEFLRGLSGGRRG